MSKLKYFIVTHSNIAHVAHWKARTNLVLLEASSRMRLIIVIMDIQVLNFSYADWAWSKADRETTTRYCVFDGGYLVLWKSKKQSLFSWFNAYGEWILQLLDEIGWLQYLLDGGVIIKLLTLLPVQYSMSELNTLWLIVISFERNLTKLHLNWIHQDWRAIRR